MKCKTCSNPLIIERDISNIKCGNSQCMPCWRKVKHDYF